MNRSKAKGTAWESAIVACLIAAGWPDAERRALKGILDKGDVAGVHHDVVIEAKNEKTICLAAYLDEANHEAENAGAGIGVAWFKRRGKVNPLDGYVLMDGTTFLWLLRRAGYSPAAVGGPPA